MHSAIHHTVLRAVFFFAYCCSVPLWELSFITHVSFCYLYAFIATVLQCCCLRLSLSILSVFAFCHPFLGQRLYSLYVCMSFLSQVKYCFVNRTGILCLFFAELGLGHKAPSDCLEDHQARRSQKDNSRWFPNLDSNCFEPRPAEGITSNTSSSELSVPSHLVKRGEMMTTFALCSGAATLITVAPTPSSMSLTS